MSIWLEGLGLRWSEVFFYGLRYIWVDGGFDGFNGWGLSMYGF